MAPFSIRSGSSRLKDIDGRAGGAIDPNVGLSVALKSPSGLAALRSATALTRGLHLETLEPRLLMSADLIPVAGSIDLPGETDFYTFTLAEERTILFDALTPEYRFNWSLEGPGGQVVGATRFDSSDGAQGGQLIALEAGNYRMAIDAEGDFTGAYQFRLINIENADVIALGDTVDGVLETAGRESDLFRFDATEGQELVFDAQAVSGGTAYWSLIGPDGTTHFGPLTFQPNSDPARFVVPQTGAYTLMLEGYIYNGTNQSYRFAVNEVTDVARTVTPDTVITGRIEVPGQRHKLTFTLDRAQTVWFDTLLPSDVTVRIDGPRGEEQATRSLQYSDWRNANPVLTLLAGSYTVTLEGAGGQVGDYAFQLLTRGAAQELSRGVTVSDVLSDRDVFKPRYRQASDAQITDAGSAQRFDASAPRITLADQAALNPAALTFETWLNADDPSFFQSIGAKNTPGDFSGGYGLYTDDGEVRFYVNGMFDDASRVSAALAAGVWTHVAGSYDGEKLRLYINGVLAEEKDYSSPITHCASALMVGDLLGYGYYPYSGQLDETRLLIFTQTGAGFFTEK